MMTSLLEYLDRDWEITVLPQPKAPGMAVVPPCTHLSNQTGKTKKSVDFCRTKTSTVLNYLNQLFNHSHLCWLTFMKSFIIVKNNNLEKIGLDPWFVHFCHLKIESIFENYGNINIYYWIILYNVTHGKRASSTRWPVSRGWFAGSFSVTGRTWRTGHTCTMVNFSFTPSNSNSNTTSWQTHTSTLTSISK